MQKRKYCNQSIEALKGKLKSLIWTKSVFISSICATPNHKVQYDLTLSMIWLATDTISPSFFQIMTNPSSLSTLQGNLETEEVLNIYPGG